MFGSAGVKLDAQQANGINTETDCALGEARGEVQLEALAPFFSLALRAGSLGTRITVIVVDIEVTQLQRCLAVFDKAGSACLLCQLAYGHSYGQGGLVHCVAPLRF